VTAGRCSTAIKTETADHKSRLFRTNAIEYFLLRPPILCSRFGTIAFLPKLHSEPSVVKLTLIAAVGMDWASDHSRRQENESSIFGLSSLKSGAETFSWPDGGTTPFKGEKNTNWEGGYRVPAMIRWPGSVPAHTEINDVFSAEDWATTLVAAAGEPAIKEKLLQGYDAAGKNFKVHLDGYDQRDLLSAKGPDKRREFFYWTDDGNLAGLRYDQWKAVFLGQKAEGFPVWQQPMIQLRLPMLFNLRSDPFERAQHESGDYVRWFIEHAFVIVPAQGIVGQHLASFVQFPPRQRPGSFSVEQALEMLRLPPSGN
jgi:hypothetical protein